MTKLKSNKTFKLPKEFAEKWLVNLKSGKYKQISNLIYAEEGYCCLGVALLNYLEEDVIKEKASKTKHNAEPCEFIAKFPSPIYKVDSIRINLGFILTKLNDSMSYEVYTAIINTYKYLIFKKIPNKYQDIKYTFEEIAEFIENNVEFK